MRILHVFDHSLPLHSGYTFRSRSILKAQHERGWQTEHVTGGKHPASGEEEEADGLRFYRTPHTGLLSKLPVLNQWHIVRQLRRRLRTLVRIHQPDVIHAHSPCLNGLAAASVAKEMGIRFVYEVRAFWEDAAVDHGTTKEGSLRYRITRALETKVFRQADAVTCICEGLKNDIIARGIPAEKITVIPNAVDIEKFDVIEQKKSTLLQRFGLQDCTVLGFLGSFYAYEGLDLLLDAMAKLKASQPNLRLLLVGGGPQEQALKAQAKQLGLEQQVIFVGRVPHAEVGDYYSLVDVLVYPRHKMRLTDLVTPLKPLEAMAQKKLVLASDVGGHHELIRDGDNGYLFAADNVNALVDKIQQVLAEREHWPAILDAGRHYVLHERNWANSVARYQAVYFGQSPLQVTGDVDRVHG
ncbi:TIGR04063 family PEP-CTERM/XrtA system glycosyltransferase [Permianibacter aggregans]|uniref:PEP-CTERM/exosortase A-associated glycosyltransferase n=1 Tax=Permianibacter aggregans TaxID=1510150 RepID=A0A4R6UTR4_9GAMM|nr:TIGR04063 family PEP-CTERM/XrtA system glycosyltransferase [Permianibacter aggregans]QGX40075.1 glycosyltransferase, exosortase A system-associated [Permianibacter aggregans]TDQ49113.1 PEP-CTERM/exosortase A-associated glycosyltransferase [Permianibacter aggregans]